MLNFIKRLCMKTNPSEIKKDDYHLMLAKYLYKELKSDGLNVKRNSVILSINLYNKTEQGHDKVIIDCLEGKLYLRGKELKDKPFGKLRSFKIGGSGDAYNCAVQSAKRISNRVNALLDKLNGLNREVTANSNLNVLGLKSNFKDLRKNAKTDINDRETAVCYIDGVIMEAYTHAECIDNYLEKFDTSIIDNYCRPYLNPDEIEHSQDLEDYNTITENIKSIAFAHKMSDGYIELEIDNLWNCSVSEVSKALKDYYGEEYNIVAEEDFSIPRKLLAKDLRKKTKLTDKKINIVDLRKNKTIKDLRKKSELFDANIVNEEYIEIFKNPTYKEIEDIKKSNKYNSIRGIIDSSGDIYAWRGDILHHQINSKLKNTNLNINEFRFASEKNYWIIDLHGRWTFEEGKQLIRQYKDKLSEFGDISFDFNMFYAKYSKFDDCYFNLSDIEQYALNVKDMRKLSNKGDYMKRLNKSANIVEDIQQGDLVDFENYGKLYVCNPYYSENYFWVTDNRSERDKDSAQGWSMLKSNAYKIIETYEDFYDEELDEYIDEEYYN